MWSLGFDFFPKLRLKVLDDSLPQVVPFHFALFGSGRWIEGLVGFSDLTGLISGYARPALVDAGGEMTGDVARPRADSAPNAPSCSGKRVSSLPGHVRPA